MEETLKSFTEQLASTAPTPGGGGAAALIGALGVSLGAMAAGLSAGRKSAGAYAEDLKRIERSCGELRLSFLAQIEADAAAFLPLSAAYRLPKDTPDREETLRRASLEACAAAREMLALGAKAAELLTRLQTMASPLLVSDGGCAAAACRAALVCAAMNVFVNTRSWPEDPEAASLSGETARLLEETLPKLEQVERQILLQLGNGVL